MPLNVTRARPKAIRQMEVAEEVLARLEPKMPKRGGKRRRKQGEKSFRLVFFCIIWSLTIVVFEKFQIKRFSLAISFFSIFWKFLLSAFVRKATSARGTTTRGGSSTSSGP